MKSLETMFQWEESGMGILKWLFGKHDSAPPRSGPLAKGG
jgi:hypothetical protein